MVKSMSRVAHCTDNGVMEGFWGILKREMYYGKKFESREELEKVITEYIDYYTKRLATERTWSLNTNGIS